MFKKIAIGIAALLLITAIGVYFLLHNIDSIAKAAIEKYGSEATQAEVKVGSVKLSLKTGEGIINGISIGHPSGFQELKSFSVESISVKIDPNSIMGNGPIIIENIAIEKPQINYEIAASGESNLQTISNNAKNYSSTKKQAPNEPSRQIIINNLTIKAGQVSINHNLLKEQKLNAVLPEIHMTNIGKKSGGATPGEIAKIIAQMITINTSNIAAHELSKEIGNLKGIEKSLKKDPIGSINELKNMFGK